MKTLQLKTGRWHEIAGADGPRYVPVVPGSRSQDSAGTTGDSPPVVMRELMGTGLRLYDESLNEGDEWKLFGNDAQALAAAAFRIRETAR